MSFETLIIRLSGDPGDLQAGDFAGTVLGALSPVLRLLPPDLQNEKLAELENPRFAVIDPPPLARMPDLPFSQPAAMRCCPFGDASERQWVSHLLWPNPGGTAVALRAALIVLDWQPGDAMVEIALPLFGLPLSDMEPHPASSEREGWRLAPSPGRSERVGDWQAWTNTLATLDAAVSRMTNRFWGVEFTGPFDAATTKRLLGLADALNARKD